MLVTIPPRNLSIVGKLRGRFIPRASSIITPRSKGFFAQTGFLVLIGSAVEVVSPAIGRPVLVVSPDTGPAVDEDTPDAKPVVDVLDVADGFVEPTF